MSRVSAPHTARKTRSVSPPPNPEPPSLLGAIGFPNVSHWTVDVLDELSIPELLAIACTTEWDTLEDPVLAMLHNLSNDLALLGTALTAPTPSMLPEVLTSIVNRLSTAALVAGELHRRQVEAVIARPAGDRVAA